MTVREFWEWAKTEGVEDYPIRLNCPYGDEDCYNETLKIFDLDINDADNEVNINLEEAD